jgi:hypothetical protein
LGARRLTPSKFPARRGSDQDFSRQGEPGRHPTRGRLPSARRHHHEFYAGGPVASAFNPSSRLVSGVVFCNDLIGRYSASSCESPASLALCSHTALALLLSRDSTDDGISLKPPKYRPHKCAELLSPQWNALKSEASCPARKMPASWSLPSSAPFCTVVSSLVGRLTKLSQRRRSSGASAMPTNPRLGELGFS